jgi:hypothetical protein
MKAHLLATILLASSYSSFLSNNHPNKNNIGHGAVLAAAQESPHPQCDEWASAGECNLNPAYMWQHCSDACGKLSEQEKIMAEEIGE